MSPGRRSNRWGGAGIVIGATSTLEVPSWKSPSTPVQLKKANEGRHTKAAQAARRSFTGCTSP